MSRKRPRAGTPPSPSAAERALEDLVFGADPFLSVDADDVDVQVNVDREVGPAFFEDIPEAADAVLSTAPLAPASPPDSAWVDAENAVPVSLASRNRLKKLRHEPGEDEITAAQLEERLRKQHASMLSRPKWAQKSRENTEPVSLLASAASVLAADGAGEYTSDRLSVTRLRDANHAQYAAGRVNTICFHPAAPIFMAGSADRHLRLYQIDGKVNPLVQAIKFGDMPAIHHAAFIGDAGRKALLTGRKPFFHVVDLESGATNRVPFSHHPSPCSSTAFADAFSISPSAAPLAAFANKNATVSFHNTTTWRPVFDIQLACMGGLASMAWQNQDTFVALSGTGLVSVYDIRHSRSCLRQFQASHDARTLAIGQDGLIAVGTTSGLVDLYTDNEIVPIKSFDNLATPISTTAFSATSSMIAFASVTSKDHLRIAHVPSRRVFQNWPTNKTPLGHVTCVDFSRHEAGSELIAIGNDRGKVLLYSLDSDLNRGR